MSQYASPAAISSPAPAPRWQRAAGILIAFAGGIAAGLMFTFGPSSGGSSVLPLVLFYAAALVASLAGGALFRSEKGALVIAGIVMPGTIACAAFNDVRYNLAHPNAGIFVFAYVELFFIILLWEGGPAWLFAVFGVMLRRSIFRQLSQRGNASRGRSSSEAAHWDVIDVSARDAFHTYRDGW